jgi:tripartite-type tricarboxylate transporter receptor subunit TctC
MNEAVRGAVTDPAIRARLVELELPPIEAGSPADFSAFLRSELDLWVPLVKASGATAD